MVIGVVTFDGELLLDELFDIHQELVLFRCAVGNCGASGTSAARAADAVHVGVGFIWQVHIDDESDIFDIDPASGNISCDENGKGSFFEFLERAVALCLRAVPVNSFCLKSM